MYNLYITYVVLLCTVVCCSVLYGCSSSSIYIVVVSISIIVCIYILESVSAYGYYHCSIYIVL